MIRINLLPHEYRRAERTSPKVFAAMLGGVVVVCSLFGWAGFVYFGELGRLEIEHAAVSEELTSKQEQVAYYEALVKEKAEYEKRSKTIQQISSSRVLWTKILDELIDVVNNDGDTERHLAWFQQLNVKPGNGKKDGPMVSMPGFVQGRDLKRVADFHEDLENAPFFPYVKDKSPPEGAVEVDEKRIPPEALKFKLSWTFLPTQQWGTQQVQSKGKR